MKKQLLMACLVGVCFCTDAATRRRENPFKDLDLKLAVLPEVSGDSKSGKIPASEKKKIRDRRMLLDKLRREKYLKLIKKCGEEAQRLISSRNSVYSLIDSTKIAKKKSYYESRVKEVDEKIRVKTEEFNWLNECYGAETVYSMPEDACRKNPFEDHWLKLCKIPKSSGKGDKGEKGEKGGASSRELMQRYRDRTRLKKSMVLKYTGLVDDLEDDIYRYESTYDATSAILESEEGQKKKSYYEKRLDVAKQKIDEAEAELDWIQRCYDHAMGAASDEETEETEG